MPEITFTGFDELADKLERAGKFDDNIIAKITRAGAKVFKAAIAAEERFGKYTTMRRSKNGAHSVYYDGNTSSGYRAYGAAVVYEQGVDTPHKKQKARPFAMGLTSAVEASAKAAMEAECDKILEEA